MEGFPPWSSGRLDVCQRCLRGGKKEEIETEKRKGKEEKRGEGEDDEEEGNKGEMKLEKEKGKEWVSWRKERS